MINHEAGLQLQPRIEREPGDIDSSDDRLIHKAQCESGELNRTHTPLLLWHKTQTCPGRGDGSDDACRNIGRSGIGQHEPEAEEGEAA
jgi:hypothetical protein